MQQKSRYRETPTAHGLPAFLCTCFLAKWLGDFRPMKCLATGMALGSNPDSMAAESKGVWAAPRLTKSTGD